MIEATSKIRVLHDHLCSFLCFRMSDIGYQIQGGIIDKSEKDV